MSLVNEATNQLVFPDYTSEPQETKMEFLPCIF